MNDETLKEKVRKLIEDQIRSRGYAAPVDVLLDIGVLSKEKYLEWRNGKVPYLEKVCETNLHKLSTIMHEIRSFSFSQGYKESFTFYKQWDAKRKIQLRFSKSGVLSIEKAMLSIKADE